MAFPPTSLTVPTSDYDLFDAWLHKIYETTQQENWFMPPEETLSTGVAMRVDESLGNGDGPYFRVFPYENALLVPFEEAVRKLNPVVAVKIKNAGVIAAIRGAYVYPFFLFILSLNLSPVAQTTRVCTSTPTPVFRSSTPSNNSQMPRRINVGHSSAPTGPPSSGPIPSRPSSPSAKSSTIN